MRVDNFRIHQLKSTIRFEADLTFSRPSGNRRQRYLTYIHSLFRFCLNPLKRFKHGRSVTHTIWFSLPKAHADTTRYLDAFFNLSVGLAFYAQEDLYFDEVVSQELLDKSSDMKEYFSYASGEKDIVITYKVGKIEKKKRQKTAQFFTLGVDSFYTLLCHKNDSRKSARHLLYIDGFDVPLSKKDFLTTVHANIQKVAKKTNTTTIFIESNLREITDSRIGWGQYHVCALASVAMFLSFEKIYMAGETFDSPDWGLRSGVDTLFSLKDLDIELVGHNVRRDITIKKILKSVHRSLFLQHVRVCWLNVEQEPVQYNCSVCQKCLRTQLSLIALGEKTPTFKPIQIEELTKTQLNSHILKEWQVLFQLLQKNRQVDPRIVDTVEKILRKPLYQIPSSYRSKVV